jgi:hypothetical protein
MGSLEKFVDLEKTKSKIINTLIGEIYGDKKMHCHITDEKWHTNKIDKLEESPIIYELTVYDLMANQHYVLARRNGENVVVEILDEKDTVVYKEDSHHYAWDELVSFAKMVLEQDKKLNA